MTPRCARERGPGGPHYVKGPHNVLHRTTFQPIPLHILRGQTYFANSRTVRASFSRFVPVLIAPIAVPCKLPPPFIFVPNPNADQKL